MQYAPQTAIPEDQKAEALGEAGTRIGTSTKEKSLQDTKVTTASTEPGETKELVSGLKYETVTPGTGEVAKPGHKVTVHYVGSLSNGNIFDSSRKSGQPFTFLLGGGKVIQGWDTGVAGMKVGEVRKLVIPPMLGYGVAGHPPAIPPNATLNFEVELLGVE
jgi:FKBP-type peptidyl-prolyl cis-trans isomerase